MLRTVANVVKLCLTPNQKAVHEEMSDRVVAAGVRREGATSEQMGCWRSTVMLRVVGIDRPG